jgi:hypothetical protein
MAHSSSTRPKPTGVTITVTDLRTHLARHLEVALCQYQHYLVERNREPVVALLGIEEYRRLLHAAGEAGGSRS